MFSFYEPLGLRVGVPVCDCFWRHPRHRHLLWAAFMSTKPEVAKRWAMTFRSLDYLVVFYYQAITTKKGLFTPFGCC